MNLRPLQQTTGQWKRSLKTSLLVFLLALGCLGLCWSSVVYAGAGSLLGLLVLVFGLPLCWLRRRSVAAGKA